MQAGIHSVRRPPGRRHPNHGRARQETNAQDLLRARLLPDTFKEKGYKVSDQDNGTFPQTGPDELAVPTGAFEAYTLSHIQDLEYMLPHMDFTLERLVAQADESCTFRGHAMVWTRIDAFKGVADGHCVTCGKTVRCLRNPAPNQIDIAGAAVAVGCED